MPEFILEVDVAREEDSAAQVINYAITLAVDDGAYRLG
jgi:hypothetical protein